MAVCRSMPPTKRPHSSAGGTWAAAPVPLIAGSAAATASAIRRALTRSFKRSVRAETVDLRGDRVRRLELGRVPCAGDRAELAAREERGHPLAGGDVLLVERAGQAQHRDGELGEPVPDRRHGALAERPEQRGQVGGLVGEPSRRAAPRRARAVASRRPAGPPTAPRPPRSDAPRSRRRAPRRPPAATPDRRRPRSPPPGRAPATGPARPAQRAARSARPSSSRPGRRPGSGRSSARSRRTLG